MDEQNVFGGEERGKGGLTTLLCAVPRLSASCWTLDVATLSDSHLALSLSPYTEFKVHPCVTECLGRRRARPRDVRWVDRSLGMTGS